ncbi:MAG: MFS transporter [Promethearchaeota archaeon]
MNESRIDSTGLDRQYDVPSLKKLIAMSFGGILWFMIFTAQARIQLYGLLVLQLDILLVTLYILIFTAVDIINDPIEARISDKHTKFTRKYGKRWILIVIGDLGMVIFLILMFLPWELKPGGGLADPNMTVIALIWIALTISLFDCFQTFTEMNEWATKNDLFRDQETRRRMVLMDAFGANLIGLLLAILMIPLLLSYFNAFDAQGKVANPNAFFYMALVVSVIFLLGLPLKMYGFWEPKEMRMFRAELDEKIERPPFFQVVKRALSDKNWVAFMITSLQFAILNRVWIVGVDLWVIHGLGEDISVTIIPQLFIILGMFIFGVLAYWILKRKGTKNTFLIGIGMSTISFTLAMFSPNIWIFAILVFIAGGGVGIQNASRSVFRLQALDDSILRHGTREEAQYGSVNGVIRSFSTAIQIVILLGITIVFGYDPILGTSNTDQAKFGLLFQITGALAILCLITGIIFWKLFDISPEKAIENKEKLLELGR